MTRAHRHHQDWNRWRPFIAVILATLLVFSLGYLGVVRHQLAQSLVMAQADVTRLEGENQALAEELRAEQARLRQLEAAGAPPPTRAPEWSEAGLTEQPRMETYVPRAREAGYDPGTTEWKTAAVSWPQQWPAEVRTSPGALLVAMVSALGLGDPLGQDLWEVTTRLLVTGDNEAIGAILAWGLQDDAVAGVDYRVTLRRGTAGWTVHSVQQREHCRRGVTGDCTLCV